MTGPRRDQYIPPSVGDDSERAVDAAVVALGELRGLGLPGDAAAALHLLASIVAEAGRHLPAAVTDARDQGCSWAQIADLLGVTRASAWQRYATPRQPG